MNGLRNVALIILGLLVGFVVNNYSVELAALIFLPLFLLWFAFWDDKKYRQKQRQQNFQQYRSNHLAR